MQEKTEKNHIFYKSAKKNDPPICVALTMPKSDTGHQPTPPAIPYLN